jgi:hypothetical protein
MADARWEADVARKKRLEEGVNAELDGVVPTQNHVEALRRVMGLHGNSTDPSECMVCENEQYPCTTVRAIANALGVDY